MDAKIERLHEAMETAVQTAVDAEKLIDLMKHYVNPAELTVELLNILIEKTSSMKRSKERTEAGNKRDTSTA